jgi:hypothetical protein
MAEVPIPADMRKQDLAIGLFALLVAVAPCAAQGFGIGARMSMVRSDIQADPALHA